VATVQHSLHDVTAQTFADVFIPHLHTEILGFDRTLLTKLAFLLLQLILLRYRKVSNFAPWVDYID
jgi:hypothetical protein